MHKYRICGLKLAHCFCTFVSADVATKAIATGATKVNFFCVFFILFFSFLWTLSQYSPYGHFAFGTT